MPSCPPTRRCCCSDTTIHPPTPLPPPPRPAVTRLVRSPFTMRDRLRFRCAATAQSCGRRRRRRSDEALQHHTAYARRGQAGNVSFARAADAAASTAVAQQTCDKCPLGNIVVLAIATRSSLWTSLHRSLPRALRGQRIMPNVAVVAPRESFPLPPPNTHTHTHTHARARTHTRTHTP